MPVTTEKSLKHNEFRIRLSTSSDEDVTDLALLGEQEPRELAALDGRGERLLGDGSLDLRTDRVELSYRLRRGGVRTGHRLGQLGVGLGEFAVAGGEQRSGRLEGLSRRSDVLCHGS